MDQSAAAALLPASTELHMRLMDLVDPKSGQVTSVWDGRKTMRTFADARDKLEELGDLAGTGDAEIRVVSMVLADGRIIGSASVAATHGAARWRILMPSAMNATARTTLGEPVRLDVEHVDGAVGDEQGNVQLRDGTYLRALAFVPVHLIERLSAEHEEILRHALRFLETERECVRHVHDSLPALVALDYVAVAECGQGSLPSLKTIERYVLTRMPNISRQTPT